MDFRIFSENLAGIELHKERPVIDKPFYVGFTVLEESKLHIQKFFYRYIKKKYGDNAKLCFTDTDSFVLHVKTDDIYKDMQHDKEMFDFSDFPKASPFFDASNKKVLGKMKDECNGSPMLEFVGLRPKMYSFKTVDSGKIKDKHRAKGVAKAASANLKHEKFLKELYQQEENRLVNHSIGAKLHKLYTYENKKRGLCAFDDKRYLLDNGIDTLSFGHYSIPESTKHFKRLTEAQIAYVNRAIQKRGGLLPKRKTGEKQIQEAKRARLEGDEEVEPAEPDDL